MTRTAANFEKLSTGAYHGVLADIVDLGDATTVYLGKSKTQAMVRFVWFLDATGRDGKQLSITARFHKNLHEKSNLYWTVKQILNATPPVDMDYETLMGSLHKLFIQRDTTDGKDFTTILVITPAQGMAGPGGLVWVASFTRPWGNPQLSTRRRRPLAP